MQGTLTKLVDWIESASPELWRIALKQVYVELWQTILGIVLCGVCVFVAARAGLWCQKKKKDERGDEIGWSMCQVFSWIGVLVIAIIMLCLLVDLPRFLNMEYVAIHKLMELAP